MGYNSRQNKMKKLIICLFVLCVSTSILSQEKQVFCEIVGTSTTMLGDNVTIHVDYGQPRKLFQSQNIVDELGSAIIFNSMIDALNWMGERGWEFVQAYAVYSEASKNQVYHFLLTKKIKEGEAINEGIHTASQMKNPDEMTKAEMAKKDENKAYIALLTKTKKLNTKYREEVSSIFPFDEILQLMQTKTVEELESMSKKHSKYFDKYEIYY